MCRQTIEVTDVEPRGSASGSYRVNCEGDYRIEVNFASGRNLETQTGYITGGVDFQDEIIVTDAEITMKAVARGDFRISQDERECSADEERRAEELAAHAKTWNELHDTFRDYAVCDDGSIAEGFSESVTRLLADGWEALPVLQSVTTIDASFQTFVLRHIDETAPADRLERILGLATRQCAPALAELCDQIAGEARRVLS